MMSAKTAQPAFDLAGWSQHHLDRVEQALGHWVGKDAPARLGEAMRYAVLDGGKRLRPLLVLAAFEAVHNGAGDAGEAALRAACAVELIHAYSLVHDDMPCMDNDVLRRGKPTVHVKFGQAQAMLAGDAMQALAFEVLTPDEGVAPALQARLTALLADIAVRLAGGADGFPKAGALTRLNQGMGGGKSHAMIGLWHLAAHPDAFRATDIGREAWASAGRIIGGSLPGDLADPQVVVLSCDNMTAGRGDPANDGPAVSLYERFLWRLVGGCAGRCRFRTR